MWRGRLRLLIGGCVRQTYDRLTTPPGWPIAVLLLVTAVADVVVLEPTVRPDLVGATVWALYFSQVALAAIWLAMGRCPLSMRIVLAFLVWLAWVCLTSKIDRQLWIMTGPMAGVVAVPLLAMRVFGLRLVRIGEAFVVPASAGCGVAEHRPGLPAEAGTTNDFPQRWQFSIGQMLGLTTAVAIVMGTMQSMNVPFYAQVRIGYPVIVAFLAGQGLLAWAALWAGLGNRRRVLRTAIFVAAPALAFLGLETATSGLGSHRFRDFLTLETVLLLASLWVFRLVGYRVVFRGGTIPEPRPLLSRRERVRLIRRIESWRREPRRVIGWLLLATVAADTVGLTLFGLGHGQPGSASDFALALYLSQVSLTAIWLAMGRSAFPLRAMLGFLVLAGWAGALSWAHGRVTVSSWYATMYSDFPLAGEYSCYVAADLLLFAVNIVVAVAPPLFLARAFGLRLARPRPDGTLDAGPPVSRRFQFSILYMFGLTTATAVLMGVTKWVLQFDPMPDTTVDGGPVALHLGLGVIAWAALSAALWNRSIQRSVGVLAAAAILVYGGLQAGGGSYYVSRNDNLGLLLFLDGGLLLGWLCVLRLAGYRLVFCWGGRIVGGIARKDTPARARLVAAIPLTCPGCRAAVNVPAEYRGQTGRCPHCGGPLSVPPAA